MSAVLHRFRRLTTAAFALLAVVALSACGSLTGNSHTASPGSDLKPPASSTDTVHGTHTEQAVPVKKEPRGLPGVGPRTQRDIPDSALQAVLVTGAGPNSPKSRAVLYERDSADADWTAAGPTWPTHNGYHGWTDDHRLGDLRTPIGVFGLTDAGGLLPDPGTALPYDRSGAFSLSGTGFLGEPLAGSFDYVVAINYNRKPGTSPLDWTRPEGPEKGGGIWLHVDHDGPTQGCVSLAEEHMKALLRALDPERQPVVVMGDAAALAR